LKFAGWVQQMLKTRDASKDQEPDAL
jgi:hypothetical protein